MNRVQQLAAKICPSDPSIGQLGSIEFNIWLVQFTGVPLLGLKNELFFSRIILVLYGIPMLAIITLCYTCCEVYDLVLNRNDFDAFTQNFCLSLTHVSGIAKLINIYYRLSDIRKAIEKLRLTTRRFVISDEQKKAFFRGEFENKLFLTIYITLVGFTAFLGTIVLFCNHERMAGKLFPYRVKLPSWLPYKLQYPYMGISVMMIALQIVPIDFLNLAFVNQIRFQLIILNLSFNELMLINHVEIKPSRVFELEDPSVKLNSIIKHHCVIIELRDEVESIFRTPILVQFLTSLVIFAVTGFQATVHTTSSNDTLIIYLYCGCIFAELFFYCWFGNEIFEQSKTLAISGYSSSWYEFDQRFKSKLLIFLTNAQRPFLFTAGGFMGLSLPSFSGILSKSYSFITVLLHMYDR